MLSKSHKLAFVSHWFVPNDGQGRVNYEIVLAALQQGHEVTVLATRCAPEIADHPNARFLQLGNDRLPTALLRVLAFANSSARWLRAHRHDFDLIQVNGFVTWERGDIAAAHFVHTSWLENRYYPFKKITPYHLYQRTLSNLNTRWEQGVFASAERVVAVSKLVKHEVERLGVDAARIDVIYNGVDVDEFRPGPSEREHFDLPAGVPLLLFVGDIKTPRKNLDTLLRALVELPDTYLAVAGAVAGSPYPALSETLGLKERVIFMGKVTRMAALMRSVDVVVYPTRYDPFGLVILEAMASGVPVITSSAAGIAENLGDAGLVLAEAEDAHGLAELIGRLVRNEVLRAKMGASGRARALDFSWSRMTSEYLALYDRVILGRTTT